MTLIAAVTWVVPHHAGHQSPLASVFPDAEATTTITSSFKEKQNCPFPEFLRMFRPDIGRAVFSTFSSIIFSVSRLCGDW
jgi:hypothetical protein